MYGVMQNYSVCSQKRYIGVNYIAKKDMSQMKRIWLLIAGYKLKNCISR